MKKIILTMLTALSFMSVNVLCSEQEIKEEQPKLTLDDIAKRHGIKIFNLPGTKKRLFVHTEQLTRFANIGWSIALLNHVPKSNQNKLFYAYSALVSLMNLKSRGYGPALYILGASWGPQYLRIAEDDETCKTHLLRGLMMSQFVSGLYEVDKIMASSLMESNSIMKKFGIWIA